MASASQIALSANIAGEEKEKEGEAEVVSAVAGNGAAHAATPMQGRFPIRRKFASPWKGIKVAIAISYSQNLLENQTHVFKMMAVQQTETLSVGSGCSRAKVAVPRLPPPSNLTWPRRSPGSR